MPVREIRQQNIPGHSKEGLVDIAEAARILAFLRERATQQKFKSVARTLILTKIQSHSGS